MKTVLLIFSFVGLGSCVWEANPPFFAQQYAGVGGARTIISDPSGDILVLGRSINGVAVIYERENEDGTIDVVQTRIVNGEGLGLNHGLAFHNGFIYAPSSSTVYRWPYTPGSREEITTPAERVVEGMPGGGHNSHPVIFDSEGRMYVGIGSNGNVDQNSNQARIVRFTIAGLLPLPYSSGELFADGLRNEADLAFDLDGVLHGVENGADNLNRPDLGGDIHNGNPAEEFNRFDGPVGSHYGYPYCFSTYDLDGHPPGTQFAWPTFLDDGTHSDEWCNNVENNRRPIISMSSHNAPLGVEFYRGQNCGGGGGAFPCNMTGDAFVSFHGSWNRTPASGYRVGWFPFLDGQPTGEDINVIFEPNEGSCPNNCIRPVGAAFNPNGHLFITADSNGIIVKITYGEAAKKIRQFVDNIK